MLLNFLKEGGIYLSNKDYYTKWQDEKNFIIDNDKLKEKKYIFSSLPKGNNYGFLNGKIRPLIYGDILSRFYRLLNKNVLFPVGVNTLSQQSFIESRKKSNMLTDDIFHVYIEEMLNLGIGINSQKTINMRHDEYLSNLQLDFIELYERGYIEYKPHTVYLDKDNNKIYDKIMKKENLQRQTMKVFTLKIRNVIHNIIDNINDLNVDKDLKEMLIDSFEPKEVLEIPLKTTSLNDLVIEMDNPEYIGGISFIFLNPNYMDINPYLSGEELSNIMKYLDKDNRLFVYTGSNATNVLTGNEIPIFISRLHQMPIYLGIPSIDSEDYDLCINEGLSIIDILDNDTLINSDFLTGSKISEAKDIITLELLDNGLCKKTIKYNHTDIVISQLDPFGALLPFLDDRGKLYSLKDFLPFNFSVQFRPILDSNTNVPGSQIKGSMSNLFTVGMAPILAILYDELSINDSIFSLNAKNEFKSWGTIKNLIVDDEKIYSELLMPIIFSNIIKYELKDIPRLIENVTLVSKTIDTNGLRLKRKNNNIVNITELLETISPDSLRYYSISFKPDTEMIFDISKIKMFDTYVKKINNHLSNMEFVNDNNLDYNFQSFISKAEELLENNDIYNFYILFTKFNNEIILKNILTKTQILDYLRIIYIIFPYTSEKLYEKIFQSKYSIINEGWPY